jgi:uncharacterized protein
MHLTPFTASGGRQVVESYGPQGFRISGAEHAGSILIFSDAAFAWPVAAMADLTVESIRPALERGGIEVLLFGCGRRMAPIPAAIRQALKEAGIGSDAMDTGAACRTYNVMVSEGRRVAAALIRPI